jgi:Common central domain of tyrosinase
LLWSENFLGGFDSAWSLGRALGSDTLPSVQLVEDTPALTPYGSFSSPLETAVHNPPDRWVSGVMATAASPGDPVFYLHHCMIDLLWAQWQLRHPGEDRYQASGAGVGLHNPMPPWTTTPADVLDHRSINTYDYPPGFVPDPSPE